MKKKVFSILLCLCMIMTLLPTVALATDTTPPTATEYAASGSPAAPDTDYVLDTPNNTLHIITAKGAAFWNANSASYLSYNIYLDNDINVSGFRWTPVGNQWNPFTGTFDGQNHMLSGLTVVALNVSCAGLFGQVGNRSSRNATVKNLTVSGSINVNDLSNRYAGGIVGYNYGVIDHCSSSATVTLNTTNSDSGSYAGGIVGSNYYGGIKNCSNSGAITATSAYVTNAGGIVGDFNGGSVTNCYNTGTVSARDGSTNNYAGGIAGYAYDGAKLTNCYNTGTVSANGTDAKAGSISVSISISEEVSIIQCYFQNAAKTIGIYDTSPYNTTGCGTFENNTGTLTAGTATNCSAEQTLAHGETLLDALNGWVTNANSADYYTWVADNTTTPANSGYPVFGPLLATITKTDATNGSFTVKVDGSEVSSAVQGAIVTVTPEADDGYELDTITVTGESTTVAVNDRSFTMPSYPVTVTVSFKAIEYTITKDASTNGSFTVKVGGSEVSSAVQGAIVTVTPEADDGYELGTITVSKTSDPNTTVPVASDSFSFTMPDYSVTVTVRFRAVTPPSNPGGGGSSTPTYKTDVVTETKGITEGTPAVGGETPKTDNGTVKITGTSKPGNTVVITITPDVSFVVGSVEVKDDKGNPVKVTENPDGTYSYVMPATNIVVDVTYDPIFDEEKETPPFTQSVKSKQGMNLNGKDISLGTYNVDGYNYTKLRDLAAVLNETGSKFGVETGEGRSIILTPGQSYNPVGGELEFDADMSGTCVVSSWTIAINGIVRYLDVYNIGGNNYFKLRDLGELLDFGVDYDKDTNTALIKAK